MNMASPFTRSALRAYGKTLWAGLLRVSGLLYLARNWVRRRGAIVLTFHRVLTDSEVQQTASLPGMIVRSSTFSGFLKYAAQTSEFVDLSRDQEWQPNGKLKLAITFDDGWSDNATGAYPYARQYHAPIAIFIVAEKTGTTLPFWPERTAATMDRMAKDGPGRDALYIERAIEALKELPASERELRIGQMAGAPGVLQSMGSATSVDRTMTWQQIQELHSGGVTFGSHTSTHEILTTVPTAQAEKEIVSSRDLIQEKLKAPCSLFSYPNGDCSAQVRGLVAAAGYKFAFLNQDPGVWTRDCDPLLIPRVNVCEYHLVDARGDFSPLIFNYAVVWNAAKGLLAQMWKANRQRRKNKRQTGAPGLWKQSGKNQLEKPY
ncbi:MAG TPA: polysaccharide deacetylase family protein [Candidatus Angelobacter sp.]|jgi:peptidoglycan/xylan/chitin deacetylase (PgdA/CDA1 family)|nr:polysaccharide deacetylase family protein [Candidatus Angelobacter sp.]